MLAACGSQDGSPPELENSHLGTISPFDTLVVKFKTELANIDKLDASNIAINQNMTLIYKVDSKGNKIATGKELRFIGADTTPGGWYRFRDDIRDESIIFKNLKNIDGYTAKFIELMFSTHPIRDIEPNNSEEEANELDSFLNTSARETSFAGILDHKFEVNSAGDTTNVERDAADFYKLELKETETITINASSRTAPFKVRFYGECHRPLAGCLNDTLTITENIVKDKKIATLSKIIPSGHWPEGVPTGSKVVFYIKVFDVGIGSPANPYVIKTGIK